MATSDSHPEFGVYVPDVTLAVARGAASGGGDIVLPEADLVVDTFESADMLAPDGPYPSKNTAGFEWYNNNRCSIVTMDEQDGPVAVWNSGAIYNPDEDSTKDWTAKEGQYCMRARYPAGNEMAEISFRFAEYHTDLWFRRWVRVPTNFTHGSLNNKWFAIFPTRTTYDEKGTTTFQTRPNGSGGANAVFQDGGVTNGEAGSTPYISVPNDRGRWMQIVYRLKWASSNTANDGIIKHWRRWEDESEFTLIHSKTDAQLYNTNDSNGMKEGFVFSWANDPYDVETEFLMDVFEVSTKPLVPAGTEGL